VRDADDLASDDGLAAALTLLASRLAQVAPRLLDGEVGQAERDELADAMVKLARKLRGKD
jgi:hypothetical protein